MEVGRIQLFNKDCFELLKTMDDNSIDVAFADLPYGILETRWEEQMKKGEFNLPLYFKELFRVCKDDAPLIFTCCSKYMWNLVAAASMPPKYDMIWVKGRASNPFLGRYRPSPKHENILVWYKKQPQIYNKLKIWFHACFEGVARANTELPLSLKHLDTFLQENEQEKLGGTRKKYDAKKRDVAYSTKKYSSKGWKYHTQLPTSIIDVGVGERSKVNPTRKPIALMKRLLMYYCTKESVVFDGTFGSGATIEACQELGCKFIGSELDPIQFKHSHEKFII